MLDEEKQLYEKYSVLADKLNQLQNETLDLYGVSEPSQNFSLLLENAFTTITAHVFRIDNELRVNAVFIIF